MGWEEGTLASGSNDKTIKIWNTNKSTLIRSLDHGHTDWIRSIISLPNGTLASGSCDSQIVIWNTYNGQIFKILRGHEWSVNTLIVLEDKLLSGSNDKTIKIWNISTGNLNKTLKGHSGWILCLQVLRVNEIISGSNDSSIKIWNINDGLILKTININEPVWIKQIYVISYIDRTLLACLTTDCLIRLIKLDENNNKTNKNILNKNKLVTCIGCLTDSRLIGAYTDEDVIMWQKPDI